MTTITAKLIKDGNNTSVRLSKQVLAMSGLKLTDVVRLDVRRGAITLGNPAKVRRGWRQ